MEEWKSPGPKMVPERENLWARLQLTHCGAVIDPHVDPRLPLAGSPDPLRISFFFLLSCVDLASHTLASTNFNLLSLISASIQPQWDPSLFRTWRPSRS